MIDASARPNPEDATLGSFARVLNVVQDNVALRWMLRAIGLAFFAISSEVPESFWRAVRSRPTRAGFWWGAGLTFFFCFVVTAVWSLVDGTFSGADQSRI